MGDEWQRLEDEAAAKISEAMRLLNKQRWAKATPEDRKRVGKALAKARKAKRRKK
jgi:TRAP-type C4-dicarboxylate transport system substrate-binding protein